MPRSPRRTLITSSQVRHALIAGQALPWASVPIDVMRRRIRVNSEESGTPQRGSPVDCTLTTILVFLLFRSTEVLLKCKVGMEGSEFSQVHNLSRPYVLLPDEERARMEEDWRERRSSTRVDFNGILRIHTFDETLAYLDSLNLNESLYWWAQGEFDFELMDGLIEQNGEVGILPDVQATVNDTAIGRSGTDYVETSLIEMTSPLFGDTVEEGGNPYLIRGGSGLLVPRHRR